jgi:hypothetical protein
LWQPGAVVIVTWCAYYGNLVLLLQAGNPAYGRFTSAEEGPSPFGSIALWEHHPLGASPLGSFTFMELNPQGAIPLGEQQT